MPPVSDPEQPKTDSSRDFLARHEGLNNPDSKDNQPAGDSSNPLTHSPSADSRVYKTGGTEPSTPSGEPAGGQAAKDGHPKAVDREGLNQTEEAGGEGLGSTTQHENQIGPGWSKGRPASRLGRARAAFSSVPTRWKVTAGMGFLGVIVGGIFFFASFLPFELIHLKHVAVDNIGGVEGKTYTTIRGRLYSTQFFFDKNGNFSGYKAQGIRRLMFENRQTNATVQALKDNGYDINIDKNTGKILSLSKLDSSGKPIPGESYTSNGALERAWSIRDPTALPAILREIYPDKSDFWINRASAQLNRRWGLTRTNWLKDYAKKITGLSSLEEKELAFKSALREKLFGPGSIFNNNPASTSLNGKECADNTADCKAGKEVNKLAGQFDNTTDSDAASLQAQELANPSVDGPGNDLAIAESASTADAEKQLVADAEKGVAHSLGIQDFNVLGASQYVCEANTALNNVVTGARVLRAAQLMGFAMSVLNIADAVQNGQSVNTAQVSALMTYLNTKDSNGRNLFAASGMQYWTNAKHGSLFSSYDRNERDQFSVGGGFTGILANIKRGINKTGLGGGCGIVTNPFVSFLGFGVSIVAGFFSDGSTVTGDLAFNLAIGALTGVAINIATQLLTPMVAGTVINGSEQGTAIGNAFVSGAETLASATGAASGMRPLTTGEAKVALADVQAQQNVQLAHTGVLARLFSPNQDHSLTTSAMMSLSGISLGRALSSPISSLANVFHLGNIFSSHTLAASTSGSCVDPDITGHNLAATPFCNTIMGVPDGVLNSPDFSPDKVDQEMNCLDNSGNTIANCSPEVDTSGNPIPNSPYAAYVKQCTADTSDGNNGIDVLHNDTGGGGYTDVCTEANPNINLFTMYHLYMTAAQSENDVLTGNLAGVGEGSGGPGTVTTTTNGNLTNPFPGGWTPNRLDQGYDGTFKDQIVAPFDGTITYSGIFNGWKGSYGVEIKSSSNLGSSVPTDTLYFTEGVYPLVKSGQQVTAGTPIAKAYPSPYGDAYKTTPDGSGQIEWGVAQAGLVGSQTDPYAQSLGGGTCPVNTPKAQQMVLNFSTWAQQALGLKPPATTGDAGCG